MYFAMCTNLTRECHEANSEQLDVCGLTTGNSCNTWWMAYGQSTYPEHGEAQFKLLFLCGNVVLWRKEVFLFCECLLSSYCKKKMLAINWGKKNKKNKKKEEGEGKKCSFSNPVKSPRWQVELQTRIGCWSLQPMRPCHHKAPQPSFRWGDPPLLLQGQNKSFSKTRSEIPMDIHCKWAEVPLTVFAGCLGYFVFDVPWQFSSDQAQGVLGLISLWCLGSFFLGISSGPHAGPFWHGHEL